jgi:hypothetical protein
MKRDVWCRKISGIVLRRPTVTEKNNVNNTNIALSSEVGYWWNCHELSGLVC